MITWQEVYRGIRKIITGWENHEIAFTIEEDSTGFFQLQGYNEYRWHSSRHITPEGAKEDAEKRTEWKSYGK